MAAAGLLPENGGARLDAAEQVAAVWGPVIVPLLRVSVLLCLAMSVMLLAEKMYMATVILAVRFLGRRPERQYRWEPIRDYVDEDLELGGDAAYPMVLVQIHLYNEREVYQLSIGAACGLSWPSDRIVVQVLDHSTDPVIKQEFQFLCALISADSNPADAISVELPSNPFPLAVAESGFRYEEGQAKLCIDTLS